VSGSTDEFDAPEGEAAEFDWSAALTAAAGSDAAPIGAAEDPVVSVDHKRHARQRRVFSRPDREAVDIERP